MNLESDKMHIITIDPGKIVVCDFCSEDFTDSTEHGGLKFMSNAVCPRCAYKFDGKKRYITRPEDGESFRDFVYRMRLSDQKKAPK